MPGGASNPSRLLRQLRLLFSPPAPGAKKDPREDLSAIALCGDCLFVADDEQPVVRRLVSRDGGASFADETVFPVADLLDLPGGRDGEMDIEGLDAQAGWLWLVGSHSLARKRPDKKKDGPEAVARDLAELRVDPNRHVLARVPLATRDGLPTPVRSDGRRTAASLPPDEGHGRLVELLRDDPHLAPFLAIPAKDNGFDIEGLAAPGGAVLVGLRGPVLNGWAVILELRPEPRPGHPDRLELVGRTGLDRPYRKHFLELDGLGVRDLVACGDDLLILAGPTMSLDGPVRLFRWPGGAAPDEPTALRRKALGTALDIPFAADCDRAEGICLLDATLGGPGLCVLYDSPAESRRPTGESLYLADLLALDI